MKIGRTLRFGYWLSLFGGLLGLACFGLVIAVLVSGGRHAFSLGSLVLMAVFAALTSSKP